MMPEMLVAGGAGLIGSHGVDLLLAQGYQVVVPDAGEAAGELGWTPTATPAQGREKTVSYFQASGIVT